MEKKVTFNLSLKLSFSKILENDMKFSFTRILKITPQGFFLAFEGNQNVTEGFFRFKS